MHTYTINFIDTTGRIFDAYCGVAAAVAAAALHVHALDIQRYVEIYTENGSTVEREFEGYLVRVEREED